MPISEPNKTETPEDIGTRVIAGFGGRMKNFSKLPLTTAITADRENLCFAQVLCYNKKTRYPGIAKLVSRLVWDQETVRSSRTTRTNAL